MICENCGKENKDTSRFCSECGKALIDKPIELDLKQLQIPAVSRKPKIIKVSMAKSDEEETEVPAKDVNSLFLPKEDDTSIPPLDINDDEEEPVQEFTILDNEPDSEIKRELDVSDFTPDFDSIEEVKPQQTEEKNAQTASEDKPMSIGGWIGTFILSMIPGLNIIFLLVWAISKKTKKSKKTFAAALLILIAVGLILGVVSVVLLMKFTNFHPSNYFNTKT